MKKATPKMATKKDLSDAMKKDDKNDAKMMKKSCAKKGK
jgi:hypothetical protein